MNEGIVEETMSVVQRRQENVWLHGVALHTY
jgi:hypothetical protein